MGGQTLPALFIGHGSPMNTLEVNRYTAGWREIAATLPRPKAILSVSAHWYIGATAVTSMVKPRVIHDFYGFPQQLFEFDYPAAGSPELAAAVVDAAKPVWVGADADSWGLDHGTWSVLAHLFPEADIPVVQLSVDASKASAYHFDLGRRLAPLRDEGVLIVASGNVVHNLASMQWSEPYSGFDWARRFDDAARTAMTTDPAATLGLARHPDFPAAAPTPDHFLPLLYLAGLADATGEAASTVLEGYAYGSLSMAAYALGATTAA